MAEHKGQEGHGKLTGTPTPVNTPVCSSFSAQLGAQVTFTNPPSGCEIELCNSGDTWPFVKSDGSNFGPPIKFPLTGNQYIYIKSSLTVGTSYSYCTNSTCGCSNEAMRTVTITD
jgi:hypothetical protein